MATKGGLERGTDDFKAVLAAFKNKTYSIYSYNAQDILKANPGWENKYEPVAFGESVRNLVANLRLVLPEFPDKEPNQHLPDPEIPTTAPAASAPDVAYPPAGTAPPFAAKDSPVGLSMMTDERLLVTPKHVVAWMDTTKNQNNRLTVYVLMPPGFQKEHYKIRIESGGKELSLDYVWPDEMLDASLLMVDDECGRAYYNEGHNKIVAFNNHVKTLRGDKEDTPVHSYCRIRLPFAVEEQPASFGVPRPSYVTTSARGHQVLAVELMGVRTNYQSQKIRVEYDNTRRGPASSSSSNGSSAFGTAFKDSSSAPHAKGGFSSSRPRGGSNFSSNASFNNCSDSHDDVMEQESERDLEEARRKEEEARKESDMFHQLELERQRQEAERERQEAEMRRREEALAQQQQEVARRAEFLSQIRQTPSNTTATFATTVSNASSMDDDDEDSEEARKEAVRQRLIKERQQRLADLSKQEDPAEIAKRKAEIQQRRAANEAKRQQEEKGNATPLSLAQALAQGAKQKAVERSQRKDRQAQAAEERRQQEIQQKEAAAQLARQQQKQHEEARLESIRAQKEMEQQRFEAEARARQEAERLRQQEKKQAEDEAHRQQQAAKEEEARRQAAEEEEARRQAATEEEAHRQAAKEEEARRQAAKEEEARRQAAAEEEEEAHRQAAEEEEAHRQQQQAAKEEEARRSEDHGTRVVTNSLRGSMEDEHEKRLQMYQSKRKPDSEANKEQRGDFRLERGKSSRQAKANNNRVGLNL